MESHLKNKSLLENMNQKGLTTKQAVGFVALFFALLLYQKATLPNQEWIQLGSIFLAIIGLYLVFVDD